MRCENKLRALAVLMAATPFLSPPLEAGELDGSKDIVCAVKDVVACTADGGCAEGRASDFDLPEFVILNAAEKLIRAAHESGHGAVSPVRTMERNGSHLVLQGVENSRGWSIAMDAKTGKMSASVVGDAIDFLVFGACTAP